MSNLFPLKLLSAATVLTLGLVLLTSSASADVGWIVQPGSALGANVTIHLQAFDVNDPENVNPDPNSEGYVPPIDISTIPQTDPGTSGDPALGKAAVNSLIGAGTGYFKTYGTDPFTKSVNFGAAPANPTLNDLTIKAANIGNFLPAIDGSATAPSFLNGQPIFHNGSPGPVNSAGTLWTQSPTSGFNALTGSDFSQSSRDNGRVATYGLQSVPTSAAAIAVTNGTFDGALVGFTGTVGVSLAVALAADPNGVEGVVSPTALVATPDTIGIKPVSNLLSGAAAQATITRGGVGPNTGPDYIMTIPFTAGLLGSTNRNGTTQLAVTLNFSQIAKANLVQGDTNFDGVVDIQDITMMANKWLTTNAQHLGDGDANGDGVVDIQDITMAANHWLQTAPALGGGGGGSITSVPEPGSLVLLGFGAVCALAIARRRTRR